MAQFAVKDTGHLDHCHVSCLFPSWIHPCPLRSIKFDVEKSRDTLNSVPDVVHPKWSLHAFMNRMTFWDLSGFVVLYTLYTLLAKDPASKPSLAINGSIDFAYGLHTLEGAQSILRGSHGGQTRYTVSTIFGGQFQYTEYLIHSYTIMLYTYVYVYIYTHYI